MSREWLKEGGEAGFDPAGFDPAGFNPAACDKIIALLEALFMPKGAANSAPGELREGTRLVALHLATCLAGFVADGGTALGLVHEVFLCRSREELLCRSREETEGMVLLTGEEAEAAVHALRGTDPGDESVCGWKDMAHRIEKRGGA